MLKNLSDSQFVRAYNTFGYNEKNVVYQLSDYFTLFYLRFMKGKQNPDEHFWTQYLDNPGKTVGLDRLLSRSARITLTKSKKLLESVLC